MQLVKMAAIFLCSRLLAAGISNSVLYHVCIPAGQSNGSGRSLVL